VLKNPEIVFPLIKDNFAADFKNFINCYLSFLTFLINPWQNQCKWLCFNAYKVTTKSQRKG